MNDKNIDDLFRDKLKDLEQAPPPYLLDHILARTAAMRRKRRVVFWRVASIAAALLLAFVAGWQISELSQTDVQPQVVVQQAPVNDAQDEKQDSNTASLTNQTQKAQETVAGHPEKNAVAKAETTSATAAGNDLQDAQTTAVPMKQPSGETMLEPAKEELASLIPTRKVDRLAQSSGFRVDELDQKTASQPMGSESTQSIDQQIIEQNKQQLLAQNETRRKNQWLVGAQVSPALSVNRSNHSSQYASDMLNSSNTSPVDLGGGLSVQYKAGKRWSIQSGIYYAGLEQSSGNTGHSGRNEYALDSKGAEYFNAPVNFNASNMVMNSSAGVIELKSVPMGVVVGNTMEEKLTNSAVMVTDARFTQNFQYLEIPLYLRYTLLDARFDVELMGGVSSNVLVGNNTYMDSSTGKSLVGSTQDMQNINYSGALGVGLKYGLSKRIYLNLEPRVKYYLNSLNNNPQVNYKPYTIGVFTGVSYEF